MRMFIVPALVLLLSGCLTTTQPLSFTNDEPSYKGILGKWALKEDKGSSDVGEKHHFLNIFLALKTNDLTIVGAKSKFVDPEDAFNACSQDLAICYDTFMSPATTIEGRHLVSLKDHYAKDEDSGYLVTAWKLENDELAVYEIKDKTVEQAVKDGKLSKGQGGNIASEPSVIAQWIGTLSADDFKPYAKYQRPQALKDVNELPSLPE